MPQLIAIKYKRLLESRIILNDGVGIGMENNNFKIMEKGKKKFTTQQLCVEVPSK